jgi:hypothetical protein
MASCLPITWRSIAISLVIYCACLAGMMWLGDAITGDPRLQPVLDLRVGFTAESVKMAFDGYGQRGRTLYLYAGVCDMCMRGGTQSAQGRAMWDAAVQIVHFIQPWSLHAVPHIKSRVQPRATVACMHDALEQRWHFGAVAQQTHQLRHSSTCNSPMESPARFAHLLSPFSHL